eukprot:5220351-Lingulodinium_polyedra.AAC.1
MVQMTPPRTTRRCLRQRQAHSPTGHPLVSPDEPLGQIRDLRPHATDHAERNANAGVTSGSERKRPRH